MRTYRRIVGHIAEDATQRSARLVMRRLQRMTDLHLSGDDSGLQSVWEEVCVQVQLEHSIYRAAYVATMSQIARHAIERLSFAEKCALWLQTPAGENWVEDLESRAEENEVALDDQPTYVEVDIVERITGATCDLAANWTNPRIRSYLEGSSN